MTKKLQKHDFREASTLELLDFCVWEIKKMDGLLSNAERQDLSEENKESFASFARTSLNTITYLKAERKLSLKEEKILEKIVESYSNLLNLESGQLLGLSETVGLALKIRGFGNLDRREGVASMFFLEPGDLGALGYNMDLFSKYVPQFYVIVDSKKDIHIGVSFKFDGIDKYEYYACKVINDINREHQFDLGSYYYNPNNGYCSYRYNMDLGASKSLIIDQIMEITFRLIDEFFIDNAKDYQKIKSASLGIIDKEEEYKILKNLSQIVHDHDNR